MTEIVSYESRIPLYYVLSLTRIIAKYVMQTVYLI